MKATLNAQQAMSLAGGARVEVRLEHLGSTLPVNATVVARTDDDILWQAELPGFDPDDSGPDDLDYRGAHWDAARVVIIAGRDEAYLIDARDGGVRKELRLGSRSMSLDFVSVFVLRGAPAAVIACSKVVWVVDRECGVLFEFPSAGPVDSVSEVEPGRLLITYLDVDVAAAPFVDLIVDVAGLITSRA